VWYGLLLKGELKTPQWPIWPVVTLRGGRRMVYSAHVEYSYSVHGKRYLSRNISFGSRYSTNLRSMIQSIVNRYPINAQVKVFYNSNNPDNAVLEPGVPKPLLFFLGFDLMFIGIGSIGYMGLLPIRR
jgi:hypothetical protein